MSEAIAKATEDLAESLFSAWQTTPCSELDGDHILKWGDLGDHWKKAWITVAAAALSQPAPSPQPAVPADCDVRKIMLDVVPGDGSGLEVYAKNVSDVERVLSEMDEKLESLLCEKACPPLEDTMLLNWLESNPATTVTEEGGQWFLGELLCQSLRDAIRKGIRFQAPTAEDKP